MVDILVTYTWHFRAVKHTREPKLIIPDNAACEM